MSNENEYLKYLAENAVVITKENEGEYDSALSGLDSFESIVNSKSFLERTNTLLSGFQAALDNAEGPEEKKLVLLDYTSFVKFLLDFYKGGISKTEGGDYNVNKDWYHPENLKKSFQAPEVLDQYCDDEDKAELSCEPILLFDDEGCTKAIYEIATVPVVMFSSVADTQIMMEATAGAYNMLPLLPRIKKVLDAAKQIGVSQLLQSVINIRSKLLAVNGKPISLKDKALGRTAPPEAYMLLRLENRLVNVKQQGAKLLGAIKAAGAEDNEITPDEFESIKQNFEQILKQPVRNATIQSMGPLLSREVAKAEQAYGLTPEALAADFIDAIETKVNEDPYKDDPNKYYKVLTDIFNTLPAQAAPVNDPALTTQPNPATSPGGVPTAGTQASSVGSVPTQGTPASQGAQPGSPKSYANIQDANVKSAAFTDLKNVAQLIGRSNDPAQVAKALYALSQKFSQ